MEDSNFRLTEAVVSFGGEDSPGRFALAVSSPSHTRCSGTSAMAAKPGFESFFGAKKRQLGKYLHLTMGTYTPHF